MRNGRKRTQWGGRRTFLMFLLLTSSFAIASSHRIDAQWSAGVRGSNLPVGTDESAFLVLSDIHFDPFANASPEMIDALITNPVEKWRAILEASEKPDISPDGADANYRLVQAALAAATQSGVKYDYVLVLGDFIAHRFPEKYRQFKSDGTGYEAFVIKTEAFVNRLIEQAFPDIPVYGVLGNNDSIVGDYSEAGAPLLKTLEKEWKLEDHPGAVEDFLAGGYYAAPHPAVRDQELIVLYTTYWSYRFASTGTAVPQDPGLVELNWLKSKLDAVQAAHKTAVLLMHIPPGVDAFASSNTEDCAKPILFWKAPYADTFVEILRKYKSVLRDSYAGHTHIDDFRVFGDSSGSAFFQTDIVPAISRDHHSPSGFQIGFYDKHSGALVDYAVSYMKGGAAANGTPAWGRPYDFRAITGIPNYNPDALRTIVEITRSNDEVRKRFLSFVGNLSPNSSSNMIASNWPLYSCAQTELTAIAFGKCACPLEGGGR
jgi:sphingomyelin phosphodiesterase acid-like 3